MHARGIPEQKTHADPVNSTVQKLLCRIEFGGVAMMSLVRLLGFTTLSCGCVTGKYREVATHREVIYVEEKGGTCSLAAHRRNHTLAPARFGATDPVAQAS